MTEPHIDATNTEERQNDTLSASVTTGLSVHSTYTTTTLHSTSNSDTAGHDQSSPQAPVAETLPTDMSDTTESDAEKHAMAGVYVYVCVCMCMCVCVYIYMCVYVCVCMCV
jgi:hypothetical protein